MALTLAQVNKAVQAQIDNRLILAKGQGYFYLASDDNEMGLTLAGAYSTSIYICHLNQQPLEKWVADVRRVYDDAVNDARTGY